MTKDYEIDRVSCMGCPHYLQECERYVEPECCISKEHFEKGSNIQEQFQQQERELPPYDPTDGLIGE